MLKLISWNTNNRIDSQRQAQAILERSPDLVALQEVTTRSIANWTTAFAAGGLPHIRSTVGPLAPSGRGPRAYGVLIASRWATRAQADISLSAPWKEKALSVLVLTPLGELTLHTVHVPPGSSNGWVKVEVLEAIYQGLSLQNPNRQAVLCGDLNTPQRELASGEIVTWAQRMDADNCVRLKRRMRGGQGLRWDTAERNVLSGLQAFGFRDAFRTLHGYEREACSWVSHHKRLTSGRRFDHVFVSEHLDLLSCDYLDAWRENGLSDHAGVETVFEMGQDNRC